MTCVVGLETEHGVFIGADSASSNGYTSFSSRVEKVFLKNCGARGEFLIGFTTSFRMGQLLRYKLRVDKHPDDMPDMEYLATIFIDAVRACLKDGGFTEIDKERESGGRFLVGYRGKIYMVDYDFQVNSNACGFYAIGSGAQFALGSLYSTNGLSPRNRIKIALRAASMFTDSVKPPYHIKELKYKS